MLIIPSAISLLLAATCCGVMDAVDHHFESTPFTKIKDPSWRIWWNEFQGWRNKYVDRDPKKPRVRWNFKIGKLKFSMVKPVQFTDAWHHFKMWMIIFICLAISLAITHVIYQVLLFTLLLGTIWIQGFNLIYNHILKNQTK